MQSQGYQLKPLTTHIDNNDKDNNYNDDNNKYSEFQQCVNK